MFPINQQYLTSLMLNSDINLWHYLRLCVYKSPKITFFVVCAVLYLF